MNKIVKKHDAVHAFFIAAFMVMGAFFGARFLWEEMAPSTLGYAIEAGQCSDGTPRNFCSDGKRCTELESERLCQLVNNKIDCKNLPKRLELINDPKCKEVDKNA